MFVDANVFIYAVGRPHPLRDAANDFFAEAGVNRTELFTSAEVLQELMHVYLSQRRPNALKLARWNWLGGQMWLCGRLKGRMSN